MQGGSLLHIFHRTLYRLQRRGSGDLLEFKDGRSAQNGIEYIKIGILRRGGNQRDLPVFDILQQGLLLLFIEGLNFVQIQQHTIWRHKRIQLGYNFLDIRCGSGGGIQLEKCAIRLLGDDIRNGCLARSARPVKNHIGNLLRLYQAPQNRALSQNMFLTIYLIKRLRPQ